MLYPVENKAFSFPISVYEDLLRRMAKIWQSVTKYQPGSDWANFPHYNV